MLEPAHEVYAVVRIVEDDWLSIELDPALLENMVPAGGDVHHVDQKAARLSDAYIGVMGPIRGDCRPRDRQPARERSVVILTVVATRVDDHVAGGERDKRVDGLGVLLVDRQPAAESDRCQAQVRDGGRRSRLGRRRGQRGRGLSGDLPRRGRRHLVSDRGAARLRAGRDQDGKQRQPPAHLTFPTSVEREGFGVAAR